MGVQVKARPGARQLFPTCSLHGMKIVTMLPHGCPLDAPNPFDALLDRKNVGFARLADKDCRNGVVLLAAYDTCNRCIDTMLRHPHIQGLRNG